MALKSAIYEGRIRHRRFAPRPHGFDYRMFQLYLDLAELDQVFAGRWLWSVDRPNIAQFRRRDYFGDASVPLDTAVRDRVEASLGRRPDGPIRVLTHGRYFGKTMNPVSFYYGFLADGETLDWVMAEITNTPWGERHAYLLPVATAVRSGEALHWEFDKAFHVSPFIGMDGHYDWRVSEPGEQLLVHIDEAGANGERVFDATLSLERRELTRAELSRALARFPATSLRVLGLIYWNALRLTLRGAPYHRHPERGR